MKNIKRFFIAKRRQSECPDTRRRYPAIVMVACVLAGFGMASCARKASVQPSSMAYTGQASWYGEKYHNKRTASGEKFNMNALTAAHRTLPFTTIVLVENLKNGRKVKVRINDRGPFIEGRIIDLSRRAAEKLDMIRDGVVPVRIRITN